MDASPFPAQRIVVTGAATELGLEVCRLFSAGSHIVTGLVPDEKLAERVRNTGAEAVAADPVDAERLGAALAAARPDVVLHLAPQRANSLLHDGNKWRGYERSLPAETAALLQALQRGESSGPPFLVYAGYAFLYGNAQDADESTPLQAPAGDPIFAAAIRAEQMVRDAGVPAAVLRLGYLYGPSFNDPAGEVYNVVDGTPASFADFMDTFAMTYGFRRPWHAPLWSGRLVRRFIAPQHIEQVALVTTVSAVKLRRELGWEPAYADYRAGLTATVQTMRARDLALAHSA